MKDKKSSKKIILKSRKKSSRQPQRISGKKKSGKKFIVGNDRLPEICVLTVTSLTSDDELLATPPEWKSHKKPPYIVVLESGRGKAVTIGDRILVKLRSIRPHFYQASVIRVLENELSRHVIGVFMSTLDGGIIEPISRKMKESFMVSAADTGGALQGELVSGETIVGMPSLGMSYAKITERLGRIDSPRAASLIASAIHSLPNVFSAEAIAEAESLPLPILTEDRSDLRNIPLVTIDGEDARDFDDAVFAQEDGDGFHIIVAIAEVAFYVCEGSVLDKTAFERGNSVYFPDRVIPMLPERLSNGLCSLVPNEDRYCLAVHIWIDSKGGMKKYEFVRGIMRSVARLTYEQVEESLELGVLSDEKKRKEVKEVKNSFNSQFGTLNSALRNLNAAYAALAYERDNRGALDLDFPEYKIHFDASGNVAEIASKKRLESHRLIECFMIAANVAAADFLLKNKAAGIYRVHEAPSEEKLEDLRSMLLMSDYRLPKGTIHAKHFNHILKSSANDPRHVMIHTMVLRSQMQAFYFAENLGHFGLSLQKYCHFTSPIRRYSDLVVHRSIINVLNQQSTTDTNSSSIDDVTLATQRGNTAFGSASDTDSKANQYDNQQLANTALHISETERRAMLAERDAADRYKVSFMARKIGDVFAGVVVGLNEYGLFVSLHETGVTGFIPVRNLGQDFFVYDKKTFRFRGRASGTILALGASIMIRVMEASVMTGSLIFAPEALPIQGSSCLREGYNYKKYQEKPKKRSYGESTDKSRRKRT